MKNKYILKSIVVTLALSSSFAYADWSYGGKFLATTAAGCVAGLGAGYMVGEYGGYDSQPKQIVTYMSGVTGCLTGALFSYFFYDDPTRELSQRSQQLQYVNDQLQLQLQATVNGNQLQKMGGRIPQNGSNTVDISRAELNNILNNMQIAKIDSSGLGGSSSIIKGLKDCGTIYPLWMGKDGFVNSLSSDKIQEESQWIPVSQNYALKVWQFYYSKEGCFEADKRYGYFENIMPGLSANLEKQLRYSLGIKKDGSNNNSN
ncbi:hypothetical protein [Fluviispira sanaruensis]|uniref:Uncharacterized protein n=1 Tax=Fluviispira sanaruensis TaxID=2493639 RepID=A0A4P2W0L7_FLUSA|nr:hypothetical protein [Fluviispira sanaruensis]BBH54712.1 hypothetical protein JCM31447_31860 [Fluviispira sanaruensis]